jgi:SPP1 gp7 family putative phage head morphogenesis protein
MEINANTKVYDRVVDRAAMVRLYEERTNKKVAVVLDKHEDRVNKIILSSSLNKSGVENLKSSLRKDLSSTFKEINLISSRSLVDLFKDQVSFGYQNLEATMGKVWKTKRASRIIGEELILSKPLYKDVALAAGWNSIATSERKRMEALIRRGIANGDTLEEMAVSIRRGNVHKITRAQARGLVITGITSVTSQADSAVYKANKDAIQGWQYVAVLDSRTSDICISRDAKIYPVDDTIHLPPAHFNCRSVSVPVLKSWDDLHKLEGVAQVRKRNLEKLTKKQIEFYDGQTSLRETYDTWLRRQSPLIQLKHLGDSAKVELFRNGHLHVNQFTNNLGKTLGIKALRAMSEDDFVVPGDTKRFSIAKTKLDALRLGASRPDDFIDDKALKAALLEYYQLQAGQLDGLLSLVNYRGALIHTKRATKTRVLTSPPTESQMIFNPITGRYEDARMYRPNPDALDNTLRLTNESQVLLARDKAFITDISNELSEVMGVNERAAVADNLRILFTRYRNNPEVWTNFKALSNTQMKFDVMNVSDFLETQVRKGSDFLKKLAQDNFIDPVLGPIQLQTIHDDFIKNITARNAWEDTYAPKLARKLHSATVKEIPRYIRFVVSDSDLQQFYLKFAHRLGISDLPDRDQFAADLGRDLFNLAGLNGSKREWHTVGLRILESKNVKKLYDIETFGVQKRRLKSRLGNSYFGPQYDTLSFNIRIIDPAIQKYSQLTRKVELGLRTGVLNDSNRLIVREGYKTYFSRGLFGRLVDTRIPITSTSSFGDFPSELIDKSLADALNWTSQAQYRIDGDYFDFIMKLLNFRDDKGSAELYESLNGYKHYLRARSDSYERFKAMEWLRQSQKAFSNIPFLDHRARIYERGFIGPQSGETFRPFLNTAIEKAFGRDGYNQFQDQVGAFLGGLDEYFEGRFNGLSFAGRRQIADKFRPQLVEIGNLMLRGKPNDIRAVLRSELVGRIDPEEVGKFFRLAIETAKIERYLKESINDKKNIYSKTNIDSLKNYKTAIAMEQDASSSGAQIIALTTRNKKLAELSNVVPTNQKRRLYDEIAEATFHDPRFKVLNEKLGLTERDLRKAAKAQNMVTFYGAGERTGILNVERKLAKALSEDIDTLVVSASNRDKVLEQIAARIANIERFDKEGADELRKLRTRIRDLFNSGSEIGDEMMEQLYFLNQEGREFVESLSKSYNKVVTPDDFKLIARIMSSHLEEEVPILKSFTKYFGELAVEFLSNAKPSQSDFNWKSILKTELRGTRKKGYTISDRLSELLGLRAGEPVSEKLLKNFGFWKPNGTLDTILNGELPPEFRRTGAKYFKVSFFGFNKKSIEVFTANDLPKSWTNVPWSNFDGKFIEQNFTQNFQQRLSYKNKDGQWITNILQIPERTEATWWEQYVTRNGKINDIADLAKARTAYAVNGNHSNDATIVKNFHLWGKKNNIATSTVHDAFFTNLADFSAGRRELRRIYANSLRNNVIKQTLDEMRARGLPGHIYRAQLNKAIELGLIPVPGRSRVGGKLMTEDDVLVEADILKELSEDFLSELNWYGVG